MQRSLVHTGGAQVFLFLYHMQIYVEYSLIPPADHFPGNESNTPEPGYPGQEHHLNNLIHIRWYWYCGYAAGKITGCCFPQAPGN